MVLIRCSSILSAVFAVFLFSCESNSIAQNVSVQVENLQPADGFYFTPVWVGFHDGSFDLFDAGALASKSLEALAEEGDFSGIRADFAGSGTDGAVLAPGGFGGAPVLDPGESVSTAFDIGADDRFFSFASMIIPSNDGFIGNDDATAYELFDLNGDFTGPLTIELFANDIYDAGTEFNDGLGAAFSAIGGTSTSESELIAIHEGFDNFLGTDTVAGSTIGTLPGNINPIARITITSTAIPEPSIAGIMLGGACFSLYRRRRNNCHSR